MKIEVIIEKDDRGYSVYSENVKCGTIMGEGKSVEEAKEDFMNTLSEFIETYKELGERVPAELINPTFEYRYDVASVLDEFDFINITKFSKLSGINPSLLRHYKRGDFAISKRQVQRIEKALHSIGEKLISASLF